MAQTFIGLADDYIHVALKCMYKAMDDMDREGGEAEQQ